MMIRNIIALCLVASAFAAPVEWHALDTRESHLVALETAQATPEESFTSWILHHGKTYLDNVQEFERRMAIWMDNLAYTVEYNKEHSSHWLGMNSLADLTHEEFKQQSLGYRPDLKTGLQALSTGFRHANVTAKKSVDWREKNAVTAVKNQQQCGSCWAFSTTGSVEGANAIYSGKLVSLSEQELVDCDLARDHGCQGGLMDFAYYFIIQNGGIDTEKDYAYTAVQGQCNVNKENRHVVTIDSYEDVPPQDEASLEKAVSEQPVSVAIQANERAFQLYSGGVFDTQCGTALDHGVLAVGYGTEDGKDYWIVKNSWGGWWGDKGYIKLVKGLKDSAAGQCGIAIQPSYPVKTSPNPPPPAPKPPGPPAPPKPQPNVCDTSTQCPAGATCCCESEFFGYCFTWACCPLENAVCCDDKVHCCPHDLPVCDIDAGRCTKGPAALEGSVPLFAKQPAMTMLTGRTLNPMWTKERVQEQPRYEQS